MSWRDRTVEERRDLRERRSLRRDRKAGNVAAVWHGKQAIVRAPIDQAALEFDRVRVAIKRIRNPVEQDAEWVRLAEVLREFGGDSR